MLSIERQNKILELIILKKNIKLLDIVNNLGISEATARRDLVFLESKNKLKRIHGGATLIETTEDDIDFKLSINLKEKEIIAQKAITHIKNGQTIYLDAGSTTACLVKYLENFVNLKVVTNNYALIPSLLKLKNLEVFLLGGKLKEITGAMVGITAMMSLKNFNFDLVFLGSNGVSVDGYSTPDPDEVIVKSEVIKRGKKVFFLCDHTKFSTKSFINFASLNEGILISDADIPSSLKSNF